MLVIIRERCLLEEEVGRQDMIHLVLTTLGVDELVEIADFYPDWFVGATTVTDTQKRAVLVKASGDTPVRVV